jgi:hypothetical protein
MENLVDDPQTEGLVTFPDEGHDDDLKMDLVVPDEQLQAINTNGIASDTVKFEQKRTMNTSKTKILSNGFSSEQVKLIFFSWFTRVFLSGSAARPRKSEKIDYSEKK